MGFNLRLVTCVISLGVMSRAASVVVPKLCAGAENVSDSLGESDCVRPFQLIPDKTGAGLLVNM